MTSSTRRVRWAAAPALIALAATAAPAAAQSVAVYGTAEAAGFGQSLVLLGASLSPGSQGLQPVVSAQGYTLRFRSGDPAVTTTANVFAPGVGVKYQTATGMNQLMVGYTFASNESDFDPRVNTGLAAEVRDGATTSYQYNYWGQGERNTQFIASYGWKSDYLWTNARSAWRTGVDAPVYVGGELGLQGNTNGGSWLVGAGPVVQFRVSPNVRLGVAGGYRTDTDGHRQSGYAKADFVWTP